MVEGRPSTSVVWKWLADVPDPEIPAISLLDLGVIRDIQWRADTLEVTVTPTYSGCPATSLINFQIEAALSARGIQKLTLKRQIAPPWTTDWMSDAGCIKFFGRDK
jgi:ring-1,2-phenylacetyl-CoA epoxidase subunit PaaD